MQSEMANFAISVATGDLNHTMLPDVRLVLPPSEMDETYLLSLNHVYSLHYLET